MGIDTPPEVNFAQRVIEKYHLCPPIDIDALVKKYAELFYFHIPLENADGITINLKVPRKKTRVVVNLDNSKSRQRFTLAHELGHILIPWHCGTILDQIYPVLSGSSDYWKMEEEASRFAAELLMPLHCIEAAISEEKNLAKVHRTIAEKCKTSAHSVAIRLSQILPSNFVYASEKNGTVEFSGKTSETLARPLEANIEFPPLPYDYCEEHFEVTFASRKLHWWKMPEKIKLTIKENRGWREILDVIVGDIGISPGNVGKYKSSLNGVIAAVNGRMKKKPCNYNVDAIVSAIIQRLDRPEFSEFVKHRDFRAFALKRTQALFH